MSNLEKASKSAIVHEAKNLVAMHGPDNCLEFTDELIRNYSDIARHPSDPDHDTLKRQVVFQANRVVKFLFQ